MQTTGDALLQAILEEPEAGYLRGIYKDWLLDHDQWDGERLLGFVLRHPESDGVRLLYADWLEGNSQVERAEFIRVQIEMVGLPCDHTKPQPCRWCRLRYRAEELALGNTSERATDVPRAIQNAFPDVMATRGFVSRVSAPLDTLLSHLPALLLRHPVQEVQATDKRPAGSHNFWYWFDEGSNRTGYSSSYHLPFKVYLRLSGGKMSRNGAIYDYRIEADALAALSRAVLEVCREEAE